MDSLGFEQGKEYILNKYKFENDEERLRDVLETIIIETAILLIRDVRKVKKATIKENGAVVEEKE